MGLGFVDALDPKVRSNMLTELWGSMAFGIFWAVAIQFVPVVLRRMGAEAELIAFYTAQTYLGHVLTSLSLVLMRGRRTKNFAVWCWGIARSTFFVFAIINQVYWVLVAMAIFWVLEAFPSAAYTRMVQSVYPDGVRGKAMSLVRLGMTAAIVVVTPAAGWMLDQWGHQALFPLAALLGILSTYLYSRLDMEDDLFAPQETKSLAAMWATVWRNRNFAIYLVGFTLYGLGALIGIAFYPLVQVDRLQLSYTTLGLLGTVQSVTWLLGFAFWGRMVDQRGGLWVLRANLVISAIVPLAYIFAGNAWGLLPAFAAQGIISAGMDLGVLNTCIKLADKGKVMEFAAVQSTVVGIRGMIGPFIGVWLVYVGVAEWVVFALGALLIALSFWLALQIRTREESTGSQAG
jgi:DHA1 family inner membrane transport protein